MDNLKTETTLESPAEATASSGQPAPRPQDFSGPHRRVPPSSSSMRALRRPEPRITPSSTMRGAPLPPSIDINLIQPLLAPLAEFDGFIASLLIERYLGHALYTLNPNKHELENVATLAARGLNLHMDLLHLHGETDDLQDLLITSPQRFLVFRPLAESRNLFLILLLDRHRANLGMARLRLEQVERLLSEHIRATRPRAGA